MFFCIDPGMADFLAETPPSTSTRPDAVEWVALAAAVLLAVTVFAVGA